MTQHLTGEAALNMTKSTHKMDREFRTKTIWLVLLSLLLLKHISGVSSSAGGGVVRDSASIKGAEGEDDAALSGELGASSHAANFTTTSD